MRWRPTAGHVMLEMLYGKADCIHRQDGQVVIHVSKFARNLYIRPTRLIQALEWLEKVGMISDLQISRYDARMRIRASEDTKQPEVTPEPSIRPNTNKKEWW